MIAVAELRMLARLGGPPPLLLLLAAGVTLPLLPPLSESEEDAEDEVDIGESSGDALCCRRPVHVT